MAADNIFPGSLFPQGVEDFPIVTNNAFNEEWQLRTMQEIRDYFFPESKVIQKNDITINDSTGVFRETTIVNEETIKGGELDEVIVESFSGVEKNYIELNDIEIVIFTSKDGAQLLRAWQNAKESVHKNPRTLALFMETDDNFNVFGSVMDFVVGAEVEKHFKSDYWKKVVEYVKKNELSVSSSDIKKLVNKSISKRSVFQFFGDIYKTTKSKIKDVSLELVESAFKGLSEGIEKWKFTEDQWNSNNPDFEYDKMPFVTVFAVGMPYKTIEKTAAKATDIVRDAYNGIKQLTDKVADVLPKRIRQKLKRFIEALDKQIKNIYKVIGANAKNLIVIYKLSPILLNAFLCGFINGLIDLIKSIFDIVALLISLARMQNDFESNKGYYTDLTYEYLENYIEAYIKFDIAAFADKMMMVYTVNLVRILNFVKSLSLSNINFSAAAYYIGYVIFGIVEIIIGIIFTGGSATVAKLFKTGADVMNKAVKTAMSIADDLLGMLRYLMRLFEKGVDEVVAFFKKITDDFFDWLEDMFKKGKADEVFDGIRFTNGYTKEKILSIPKGKRPAPSIYLSKEYIENHLRKFEEEGASCLVSKRMIEKYGKETIGRQDGQFVMLKKEMDELLEKAKGNVSYIEKELGIPLGVWEKEELIRIDVPNVKKYNIRIPTGNENGANELWLPGGKLPNGYLEAVTDAVKKGDYKEINLKFD